MQVKQIKEAIERCSPTSKFFSYRPKDFIAYKLEGLWYVNFTSMEEYCYELTTKRRGDKKENIPKSFVKLDSVEACFKKLGVNEFIVIINI